MRFLLDVNVGATIARALADHGHDMVRAALTNAIADDAYLLDLAIESERILVTYDREFSAIIFGRVVKQPIAVIYIRYEPEVIDDVVPRILEVLDFEQLRGHMTVIDDRRTRRAPFPSGSNDNA